MPTPEIAATTAQPRHGLAHGEVHDQGVLGDTSAATPAVIRRVRFLLVAVTVLMIPNVSFYAIGSVTAGDDPMDPFGGPAEWFATICVILLVGVPLAAIPTALSSFIGRGHNWARITSIVLFAVVGLTCGCFGAFFPFLDFAPESQPSPVAAAGIGLFTVVISTLLLAVVVMLIMPKANTFFRDHKRRQVALPDQPQRQS